MPELAAAVDIAAPIATVFDFATTPANWPRFWAITLGVTGSIDRPAPLGARWVEQVKLPIWRGEFHWEATRCVSPTMFTMRGRSHTHGRLGRLLPSEPGEIRYALTETATGTHFARVMDYPDPNVALRIFDVLVMRPQMRRAVDRALARLKELLEADR